MLLGISNICLLEYSIRDIYKDIILQGVGGNDEDLLSICPCLLVRLLFFVTLIFSNISKIEYTITWRWGSRE